MRRTFRWKDLVTILYSGFPVIPRSRIRHSIKKGVLVTAMLGCFCVQTALGSNTVNEADLVPDFGDNFATATGLPSGTCIVNGTLVVETGFLNDDYVEFVDISPGAFSLDYSFLVTNFNNAFENLGVRVFDDTGTLLAEEFTAIAAANQSSPIVDTLSGNLTSGSSLVVGIWSSNGETGMNEGTYNLDLQVSAVPEPGSAGILAAAALLGAGGLRRRRKPLSIADDSQTC